MRLLEARIRELCAKVSECRDDDESEAIARELLVLIHEYLERARGRLIVLPPLLAEDPGPIDIRTKKAI